MAKAKISDLRNTIANLERMLEVTRGQRDDAERQLCEERGASNIKANEHRILKQVVSAQAETIAAQKDLIETFKARDRPRPHEATGHTPTIYGVKVASWGESRIEVIRTIRALTPGTSLKDAKDASEGVGYAFEGSLAECHEAHEKLTFLAGATAVIEARK